MRLASFLCMGGLELSNGARVESYVKNVGVPYVTMGDCSCYAIDAGYDTPLIDPSPWYEPTRPESADFLGFMAENIQLLPVHARRVNQTSRNGSSVGPLTHKGRVLSVEGTMWARSAEGMSYGERWLSEALRDSPCSDGDCAADDLKILPTCPEQESYDADRYFRTLVNVGVVDGPIFSRVVNREHYLQQAAFTLTSGLPWLYHPLTRCLDAEVMAPYYANQTLSCALTTPEWMGEGTFVIDIQNIDTVDVTDITITGQISLNGSCPVSGLGTSVPASWEYTVPVLPAGDRIVIDGMRRQVRHYDASRKAATNGLAMIEFESSWIWCDVGQCSTMCVSIDSTAGEAEVTVDSVLREF